MNCVFTLKKQVAQRAMIAHLTASHLNILNSAQVKDFLIGQGQLTPRSYMWTLPDRQGDSLKWAIKFLQKHATFYKIKKSPWNELAIFLYILYIFEKPPWNEKKTSLIPFLNWSHVCKVHGWIQPNFKLIREYIVVLVTCKNEEVPIKN